MKNKPPVPPASAEEPKKLSKNDIDAIDKAIDNAFARELATMYFEGDEQLLERCIEYGKDVHRLMIECIISDALAAPKIKGGHAKFKNSPQAAARSQVFEFFKTDSHRMQDDGKTPLYKSRAAWVRAAYAHCIANPVPNLDLFSERLPELIEKWTKQDWLPIFYPDHWKTQKDWIT